VDSGFVMTSNHRLNPCSSQIFNSATDGVSWHRDFHTRKRVLIHPVPGQVPMSLSAIGSIKI